MWQFSGTARGGHGLGVSVDDPKLHAIDVAANHPVDGVGTTAADADDLLRERKKEEEEGQSRRGTGRTIREGARPRDVSRKSMSQRV